MLIQVKKAFQKALFPDKCQACSVFFHCNENPRTISLAPDYFRQAPIERVFQKEMSPFLCPDCLRSFAPLATPFCTQCGRMFASPVSDNHQCGDCIKKKKPYLSARSAGLFTGALMETIHRFKYAGKTQFAEPFGLILFSAFIRYFTESLIDLIVPVPLHASKLKERGFNQSIMILRSWPKLISQTNVADIHIDLQDAILHRKRKTESQTGLGKENRKANIKGAFTVKYPERIQKKSILLVDDVFTTGATAEECAKTLMKQGAGEVHVLTLARV